LKGILQSQPISASCVLGDNKLICILTKDSDYEINCTSDYDIPSNFNVIIEADEFKNFSNKNLENFAFKLFE